MTSFDSEKIAEIHRQLHSRLPSDPALRVKAIEGLLTRPLTREAGEALQG